MADSDLDASSSNFTIVNDMDEIIPNLWVGSIRAVSDVEGLRRHNIHSVLSAMRGRVKLAETFTHFQIQLDDTEDSDALAFFPQCIAFIENELEAGRGVLVHCMAGMSRSATICCAYLMYAKQVDAQTALDMLVKARPSTMPNDGFLAQLDIFYQASYKVSKRNKVMRMYYLERALDEIMQGGGELPEKTMFPSFPHGTSPDSESSPPTPGAHTPRRRIRCKMCRTELAAREHMLDHGQVGPATPATPANGALSPATSRRPSTNSREGSKPFSGLGGFGMTPMSAGNGITSPSAEEGEIGTPPPLTASAAERSGPPPLTPLQAVTRTQPSSRRNSITVAALEKTPLATLNGEPVQVARRLSTDPSGKPLMDVHALREIASRGGSKTVSRAASFGGGSGVRRPSALSQLVMTSSEEGKRPFVVPEGTSIDGGADESAIADDDDEEEPVDPRKHLRQTKSEPEKATTSKMDVDPLSNGQEHGQMNTNVLGEGNGEPAETTAPLIKKPPGFLSPADLTAQLNAHPKLAALRSPSGTIPLSPMTPLSPGSQPQQRPSAQSQESYHASMASQTANQASRSQSQSQTHPFFPPAQAPSRSNSITSRKHSQPKEPDPPPLLNSPTCSGYFLEPMTWMESFLSQGSLGGKIICPNSKCGAKLGNYDWAGVRCACKEWVVPGFCVARGKVDEVVVRD